MSKLFVTPIAQVCCDAAQTHVPSESSACRLLLGKTKVFIWDYFSWSYREEEGNVFSHCLLGIGGLVSAERVRFALVLLPWGLLTVVQPMHHTKTYPFPTVLLSGWTETEIQNTDVDSEEKAQFTFQHISWTPPRWGCAVPRAPAGRLAVRPGVKLQFSGYFGTETNHRGTTWAFRTTQVTKSPRFSLGQYESFFFKCARILVSFCFLHLRIRRSWIFHNRFLRMG